MKILVVLGFCLLILPFSILSQSGCTDTLACNYDPTAGQDDGSCLYIGGLCLDGHPATYIDETCTCVSPEDAVFSVGQMIADCDGNFYHTVVIEGQEWMVENLRTTCFSNGDSIVEVADGLEWVNAGNAATAARVKYNNSDSIAMKYGFLYNGYAMNDTRGICPVGWHVPVTQDYRALVVSSDTLDGLVAMVYGNSYESTSAAASLKLQSEWGGYGGDNTSGISALPAGKRKTNGQFADLGVRSYWWCADGNPDNLITRGCRTIGATDTLFREDADMKWGCAIRCVRDLSASIEEIQSESIDIYPNPSSDVVSVYCNSLQGRVVLEVIDMQGKIVSTYNGNAPLIQLNISKIPSGTYILKVIHSQKVLTDYLIIER